MRRGNPTPHWLYSICASILCMCFSVITVQHANAPDMFMQPEGSCSRMFMQPKVFMQPILQCMFMQPTLQGVCVLPIPGINHFSEHNSGTALLPVCLPQISIHSPHTHVRLVRLASVVLKQVASPPLHISHAPQLRWPPPLNLAGWIHTR